MFPPTDLPVEGSVDAVAAALDAKGLAVLVAPPGSGKTTVVPLRLFERNPDRTIVVLEPRRLATRAAARRMADLLGEAVGETVGYVVRDERRTSSRTRIEVVTEGVLTRRLQRDPELAGTGLVVFDELHERNLQTDLGLALALDVREHLRPDLELLAMSATLDADRVAVFLGDGEPAPVVTSHAALHPVEVRWVPTRKRERIEDRAAATVRAALRDDAGDVLVFLPGMAQIRRVEALLRDHGIDSHVLHGSLSLGAQDAALMPGGHRKVVLSTDIAESSLTVEGVGVVIDSGLARKPRFDAGHGMTRLRTVPISKASAEQRAGRAGRLGPGVAYRLWSKLEQGGRRAHAPPEIAEVDLAGLALEIAAWGSTDLRWLDPPPPRALEEARRLLQMLGATDADGHLTGVGRAMADLPLHPRLARMIVDAADDQWLACVLAALLDDRDIISGHPDERPVDVVPRLLAVEGVERHEGVMRGAAERVRRTAADLARRAGIAASGLDVQRAGAVLALAYPDRLAARRGSPGRFQLRTGTTAWMHNADPLAPEAFVIAADLDGKRKDARIRLAAAIESDDVAQRFAHDVTERTALVWVGDRLVQRAERRLGGLALDTVDRRPAPGSDVRAALLKRIRDGRLIDLPWTSAASSLRARVRLLHARFGSPWPDWSDDALVASLEEWLPLGNATGLDDVAALDLARVLRASLGHSNAADVDRLAPTHVRVPSGRRVELDYTGPVPVLAVRVQEMFGSIETPRVAGEPVVLQLLSPADRPVQITQDLAGFWAGSWSEVRKDMAGRYPKHDWPDDPATAAPHRK